MTLFTKLKTQTAELEAALGKYRASPPADPIDARGVTDALAKSASSVEEKLIKLRKKAMLTGEARIFNENKSAEILLFCTEFDRVLAEVNEAAESSREMALVHEAKVQEIAKAEAKAAAEKAAAEKRMQEAAAAAAAAAALEVEAREAAARMEAERLATEREAAAKATEREAAAKAEAERKALADAEVTAQAAESAKMDFVPPTKVTEPEVDPEPKGYYLNLAIVIGDAKSSLQMELPDGDSTTIETLKTMLALTGNGISSNCILFTGGRQLTNPEWTLRKCRVKRGAVVHVGVQKV